MTRPDTEALAARLAEHPDYRVLRRLDVTREWPAVTGRGTAFAVVLDTETTGMDSATDKVIELALVKFEYSRESGAIGRVFDTYDGLEDPGMPIPPESTAIHHITDDMVRDQRLDEAAIGRVLEGAGLIIAHNAGFDRPFVEARLPAFRAVPWACSLKEVPWDSLGLGSAKLDYLAYRYGFFFEGHRAEIDCRALLEVLRSPIPEFAAPASGTSGGTTAFRLLLDSAREPSCRVWATGSAFETKDVLRARGYRWEGDRRCWYGDVPRARLDEELAWLKKNVYGGRVASVEVETFDARTRYSGRNGNKERVTV
jgi:DNA polymerase-3 subunit epsilon